PREPGWFFRRSLRPVRPKAFPRIRPYARLANGGDTRAEKIARARELIAAPRQFARELTAAAAQLPPPQQHPPDDPTCEGTTLSEQHDHPCPHCRPRMLILERFEPGQRPRHRPSAPVIVIRMNTS